jgi:hypothetical protein
MASSRLRRLDIPSDDHVPRKGNLSRFLDALGREPHSSRLHGTFDSTIGRLGGPGAARRAESVRAPVIPRRTTASRSGPPTPAHGRGTGLGVVRASDFHRNTYLGDPT